MAKERETAASRVDLAAHERAHVERLRRNLFGGWRETSGTRVPFVDGVAIESVELQSTFPDSYIVARFRTEDRPGIAFARRWDIYDERGTPTDLEYVDIYLKEDIEAGGPPPLDECRPDANGVVWF